MQNMREKRCCAAFKGNIELCEYLIEKKANVNHKDRMGTTALILAAV